MNHSGCNRDLELIKDFLVQRVNEEKVGHLIDVLDRVMDQINEEGKEQMDLEHHEEDVANKREEEEEERMARIVIGMDLEHHEEDKAYWRYNE